MRTTIVLSSLLLMASTIAPAHAQAQPRAATAAGTCPTVTGHRYNISVGGLASQAIAANGALAMVVLKDEERVHLAAHPANFRAIFERYVLLLHGPKVFACIPVRSDVNGTVHLALNAGTLAITYADSRRTLLQLFDANSGRQRASLRVDPGWALNMAIDEQGKVFLLMESLSSATDDGTLTALYAFSSNGEPQPAVAALPEYDPTIESPGMVVVHDPITPGAQEIYIGQGPGRPVVGVWLTKDEVATEPWGFGGPLGVDDATGYIIGAALPTRGNLNNTASLYLEDAAGEHVIPIATSGQVTNVALMDHTAAYLAGKDYGSTITNTLDLLDTSSHRMVTDMVVHYPVALVANPHRHEFLAASTSGDYRSSMVYTVLPNGSIYSEPFSGQVGGLVVDPATGVYDVITGQFGRHYHVGNVEHEEYVSTIYPR